MHFFKFSIQLSYSSKLHNYTTTGVNDNWSKSEIVYSYLKLSNKNTSTERTHTVSKDKRLHVGGFFASRT